MPAEPKLICPTGDQCSARALLLEHASYRYYACWYPQMGGYHGKCVVKIGVGKEQGHCFDVFVWHDGDFPFDDDNGPRELHHCDSGQFVLFGNFVSGLQEQENSNGKLIP